jgi:hypothetical protein
MFLSDCHIFCLVSDCLVVKYMCTGCLETHTKDFKGHFLD